jgi:peptidoglycan/LPS O-acetylase OafA/YrhL
MVLGRHEDFIPYWNQIGWAGVDLFFVLSGFLVAGLLFADYQKRGAIDFRRFWLRRGFKIWPAFYALIATGVVVALLNGEGISKRALLSEVFFLQSYFQGIWGLTWSLAVEEHFYLALPILLFFMVRKKSESPFAMMPYVFGAIAVCALALRFAVGWAPNDNFDFLAYLYPTHLRIDSLMFGVLLSYYYWFKPKVFRWFAAWPGGWLFVGFAILLLSAFRVEDRDMHTWGLTILYLGAGVLVAKAVSFQGPTLIALATRPMAVVGVYSYSIYLWHLFFKRYCIGPLNITSPSLRFWAFFFGSILFGILMAHLIELPALRLRDTLTSTANARSPVKLGGQLSASAQVHRPSY